MTSVTNNINSYDAGVKPFKHDTERGKWKSGSDFYFGCIAHAFGMKCFSILPMFIQFHGGIFFIIPFAIGFLIFVLPIFIFQSFLGQFSSTGFISVFRISPLFKGIGYVILVLNIASVCYYSAIIAYPLIYFFASFDPDLPWMSCNHSYSTPNCTSKTQPNTDNSTDDSPYYWYSTSWSTLEYFELGIANRANDDTTRMAWPVFFTVILIWMLTAAIFYKGFEIVNIVIRFCAITSFVLFGIFFVRIICLPGAFDGVITFFTPHLNQFSLAETFVTSPFVTVFMFGSGWGTVLTLASYNHFKTDIIRASKWIGFVLMILFGLCTMATFIVEEYLEKYLNFMHYSRSDYLIEFVVVAFPYLIGNLENPNMWGMIFFGMLFLCEFCGLVIQLLAIVTAIFDEFESLRTEKQRTTLAIISCIGLISLMFATNRDLLLFSVLVSFSGLTQMIICFLELIVVVWFYGRERFQRDIQFMLGKTFATWKFFIIRFLTPLCTLVLILFFLLFSIGGLIYLNPSIFEIILLIIVKLFPWICIPAYIGIKLANTTGTLYHRFKKSIWPTDWYPVDPVYKQRYEETLGTSDISHQLIMMKDDDVDDNEEC